MPGSQSKTGSSSSVNVQVSPVVSSMSPLVGLLRKSPVLDPDESRACFFFFRQHYSRMVSVSVHRIREFFFFSGWFGSPTSPVNPFRTAVLFWG